MPNVKRWIEVEDPCFGPDHKSDGWEIILFVRRCISYSRQDGTPVTQRKRGTWRFCAPTKRGVAERLVRFTERPDVVLLEPANPQSRKEMKHVKEAF